MTYPPCTSTTIPFPNPCDLFLTTCGLGCPALQKHVARGALRVCVLDRLDPRASPDPAALAWDYDIVITTFKCLSYAGVPEGQSTVISTAAAKEEEGLAGGSGRGRNKGGSRNLGRAVQQVGCVGSWVARPRRKGLKQAIKS